MVMKIAKYLGLTLAIVLMAFAVITFAAPRFGWRIDVVLSGSMEPQVQVGSLVVTRPLDIKNVKVNDIITFRSPQNGKFTTHRVIAVENSPVLVFRTKGDANEDADLFIVGSKSVAGKVCISIPYLGYATRFIKSRLGLLITLYLPGLIIVLSEARNIWRRLAEEEMTRKQLAR